MNNDSKVSSPHIFPFLFFLPFLLFYIFQHSSAAGGTIDVFSFDAKSDVNRLLWVLLDAIVAFRVIDLLVTFIISWLWVMDLGVESILNSVQTLPAIETGLSGYSDHLFSLQATLPRRAAKARPLRVTGWFRLPLRLDPTSFLHCSRVLDEAAATCFFAKDLEEKTRDTSSSIKLLDALVTREERYPGKTP